MCLYAFLVVTLLQFNTKKKLYEGNPLPDTEARVSFLYTELLFKALGTCLQIFNVVFHNYFIAGLCWLFKDIL